MRSFRASCQGTFLAIARDVLQWHFSISNCSIVLLIGGKALFSLSRNAIVENTPMSELNLISSQISNSKGDGRPLDALLIRPIQRLPSVLLLLKDFHRELEKAESKYSSIVEMSFDQMKLILERLNKEKGIDEGRQRMLNLATTVENFPQGLVSSHRILLETSAVQGK